MDPSPGPWVFHTHVYGLANVLLDRDGRVISCHLPKDNGALISKAPAMEDHFCDLLAGVPVDQLRPRAAAIMRQIEGHRVREPGEDDEQYRRWQTRAHYRNNRSRQSTNLAVPEAWLRLLRKNDHIDLIVSVDLPALLSQRGFERSCVHGDFGGFARTRTGRRVPRIARTTFPGVRDLACVAGTK